MEQTMSTKDVIKKARYKLMLNQREFAKKLHINHSMVSLYESGLSQPSMKTIRKIIEALNKEGIKVKFEDFIEE